MEITEWWYSGSPREGEPCALGQMAETMQQEKDLLLELSEFCSANKDAVKLWLERYGGAVAAKSLLSSELALSARTVFAVVAYGLSPFCAELLRALNNQRCCTHYWSSDPAGVKELSDEAFVELVRADCARSYRESTTQAWLILRYSQKRSEHKYAQSVAGMKSWNAINTSYPGGKLHRMAEQYSLQSQDVLARIRAAD